MIWRLMLKKFIICTFLLYFHHESIKDWLKILLFIYSQLFFNNHPSLSFSISMIVFYHIFLHIVSKNNLQYLLIIKNLKSNFIEVKYNFIYILVTQIITKIIYVNYILNINFEKFLIKIYRVENLLYKFYLAE